MCAIGLRHRWHTRNLTCLYDYRFTNLHDAYARAFTGVRYRLPLLVEGTITVDTESNLRPGLAKEFQLTPGLS